MSSQLYAQSGDVRRDTLSLSLRDAVARADRAGFDVRTARAAADVAGAQVTIARAPALPQLRFSGGQTKTLASARGAAVGSVFNQPNTYSAGLALSQTLFQGGKAINGVRAANAVRGASEQDVAEARAQLNLATQTAYLQALFTARLVEIQQQAYDLSAARLRQAEQFFKAGRFSRYQLLQARVDLANLEPQLLQTRENAEVALLDLKHLIDVPETQPIRLTTHIDSGTIAAVLPSIDTTIAPTAHPALRAAELNARAQRLGVSVAKGDLLPSVALTYNFGYGAYPAPGQGFPTRSGSVTTVPCPTATDPDKTCTQQNGGWFADRSLALTISWPLFDGLRSKGAIDLASAQSRIADAALASTRSTIYTNFAKAKAELGRTRAQYGAQRETVAEATEAYKLAELRYQRGLATQIEVSNAQLALTTAETNQARAVYDYYLATAALARAQGQPLPLPASAP
jgi:outer membrane protein TolC